MMSSGVYSNVNQHPFSIECSDCGKVYKNKNSLNAHKYNSCKYNNKKKGRGRPRKNEVRIQESDESKTDVKLSRKRRCNECSDCLREDCGNCRNCLDKPKFGGKNQFKQACILRSCQNMKHKEDVVGEFQAQDTKNQIKNHLELNGPIKIEADDIFNSDDEAYWNEFCGS